MEGNLRFKIDWASLIVGRKFTIFALFCFVLEGKFQVQAPWGAYIRRGDLMEGFLRYDFGGLIFGGAYTLRGLFSEFYGTFLGIQKAACFNICALKLQLSSILLYLYCFQESLMPAFFQ